jgi:hypothetical protein
LDELVDVEGLLQKRCNLAVAQSFSDPILTSVGRHQDDGPRAGALP